MAERLSSSESEITGRQSVQGRLAGLIAVLTTALIVLTVGLNAPKHNWDTIGYVAAIYQDQGYSGRDLLTRTYADLRSDVGGRDYRELTEGKYRATVASDPRSLEQQIPFYSIRIVYVGLVRLTGMANGSFSWSAHLVSAFFGFLSVVAMGLILLRQRLPVLALPLFVLPTGIVNISRVASPDSLACFVSILLVMCLSAGSIASYFLIAALPLMRTDYVIFSLLAAIYMFRFHDRKYAALAALVAIIVYELAGKLNGNLGYFNLLHFTFLDLSPYPAQLSASHNPRDYFQPVLENVNYFVSDGLFLLFAAALVVIVTRFRLVIEDRSLLLFLVLPTVFALSHFALFPHYDNRFLVSSFFLVFNGLLVLSLKGTVISSRGQAHFD